MSAKKAYSYYETGSAAKKIEYVEEKKKALSVLMKTQVNKDFTFEDKLTTVVSIIRIDTLEFTAKKRMAPKK